MGPQQPTLENKKSAKATARIQKLCDDIGNAFRNHKLDLLGLCELGEHLVGLHGKTHFGAQTQEELMKFALKTLGKLATTYPMRVSRGLHLLVAPTWGGEPVLPRHLRVVEEEEEYPMLPLRAPTTLERRAARDASLVSSRTRSARGE